MAKNFWPTPQDYNEAIQNPHACFSDPDLRSGTVETNAIGLPRAMTGAFASVYKVTSGSRSWAVRCFLTSRLDQKDRYKEISDFVLFDNLDCTIDFHYVEEGIKVKGIWYPCLKMPWVAGDTLDQYLAKNYNNSASMKALLASFHEMVNELECAGIAHGDLQHGNVIVTPDGLRLVDYDALFVPALLGRTSLELGHPNYQHPDRNEHHYDPDVDNFSCWLIHASLLAVAIDPLLYEQYQGGDESILFKRTDLARPEQSELFTKLLNHPSANIREAASLIERMLWAAPTAIPILDCPEELLSLLPTVRGQQEPVTGANPLRQVIEEQSSSNLTQSISPNTSTQSRFDFIDEDVSMLRLKPRKKDAKLAVLNQNRKRLMENMHVFFAPRSWIHQHMNVALRQFDRGEYDRALNTYLRIYKVMEKRGLNHDAYFFWCLMGLGYCSGLSDKNALAGNYFLLAHKHAVSDFESMRASICLAFMRYSGGDRSSAMRVLTDGWKNAIEFRDVIATEITQMLILHPDGFSMLKELSDQLYAANDPRWRQISLAAKSIFDGLAKTNSIAITEEITAFMLKVADAYIKESDFAKAQQIYQEVGRIALKEGQTLIGQKALFLSSALATQSLRTPLAGGSQQTDILLKDRTENLNLLAPILSEQPATVDDRIAAMVEYCKDRVSPAVSVSLLADLTAALIEGGFARSAVQVLQLNLELSRAMPDQQKKVFGQLRNFDNTQIYDCIEKVFLSDKKADIEALIRLLSSDSNYSHIVLAVIDRLAINNKTVLLTSFLMHAIFDAPTKFAKVSTNLRPSALRRRKVPPDIVITCFVEAAHCFVEELELQTASEPRQNNRIMRLLTSLEMIRAQLYTSAYEVEAEWIVKQVTRPQVTASLLVWLRALETKQLLDFLRFLIKAASPDTIANLVLQLLQQDRSGGFEILMSNLKTWGNSKEVLETLILSSVSYLQRDLSELILEGSEVETLGTRNVLTGNFLKQLKLLYRVKSLTLDVGIERACNLIMERMFTEASLKPISLILQELRHIDELELLEKIIEDILAVDQAYLAQILEELSQRRATSTIISIANQLIRTNNSLLVVSVLEKASAIDQDFFESLSSALTKDLTEEQMLSLLKHFLETEQEDSVTSFLSQVKKQHKPETQYRLLRNAHLESSAGTNGPEHHSPVVGQPENALGDFIHLAALSGEERLNAALTECIPAECSAEQNRTYIRAALDLCRKSLDSIADQMRLRGEANHEFMDLARLNMTAIERLSKYLSSDIDGNDAIEMMQSEEFAVFALNWILDLAERNNTATITEYAQQAHRLGRIHFLEELFIELSKVRQTRAIVSLARAFCDDGKFGFLTFVSERLLSLGLLESFGSISLELVTSKNASEQTLVSFLKMTSAIDKKALQIALRQISFYRGKRDLSLVCAAWEKLHEHDSLSSLVRNESLALGLIS